MKAAIGAPIEAKLRDLASDLRRTYESGDDEAKARRVLAELEAAEAAITKLVR